jgi:predicted dinucleotide-binding enzyme
MRVAVIGRGNIGGTVGGKLAAAGHDVVYGSRNPDMDASDITSALAGADAVLLAIPAAAVPPFLDEHGAALETKLVIDATNNVAAPVANAAAAIAVAAPSARYVRAFNALGWENFADPDFDGVAADLFYSAPDADRETVDALIADVGLRPIYLGPDNAEVVDALLRVWFALWQQRGHRHIALRVLE